MEVNFAIKNNTAALNFKGIHIDLHNNFNFVGLDYQLPIREIHLKWVKSMGDWVGPNEFSSLILIHRNVTFFKVIEQDENSTPEDDSCLGEITFFPSSARDFIDSYLPQENPKENDDIKYFFEGGLQIIIHCKQIHLEAYK
ncbi:hypothetical protein ACFOWA_01010 [Pedobacter lithocola]|uniref:Uncharacterized protein n=1 Tax=Pedobacter lithocola TaxID=1908239 RepID=A0ABV8P3C3_9SPHI